MCMHVLTFEPTHSLSQTFDMFTGIYNYCMQFTFRVSWSCLSNLQCYYKTSVLNEILQQERSKKIKIKRSVTKIKRQTLSKDKRNNTGRNKSVEMSDNRSTEIICHRPHESATQLGLKQTLKLKGLTILFPCKMQQSPTSSDKNEEVTFHNQNGKCNQCTSI
jgi:hypothetical protein